MANQPGKGSKKNTLAAAGILGLGLVIIYIAMISLAQPIAYDLKVGDVAQQTISATKDVVDELTTERRKQDARDRVLPIYYEDTGITQRALTRVSDLFAAIEQLRPVFAEYRDRLYANSLENYGEEGTVVRREDIEPDGSLMSRLLETVTPFFDEAMDEGTALGQERKRLILSDYQLKALLRADDVEFAAFRDIVFTKMEKVMGDRLRETDVEAKVIEMRNQISSDIYSNINIQGYYEDYPLPNGIRAELIPFANNIFEAMVMANEFVDVQASEQAREEAAAAVEPIIYKKGQSIVREGDLVQENQLAMIEALGMLKESQRPDIALYIGMALITLLLGLITTMNFLSGDRTLIDGPRKALLVVSVLVLALLAAFALKQINIYVMPMHFMLMVLAVLLSPMAAQAVNLLLGVMFGVLSVGSDGVFSSSMIELLIVSQIGGIVAAFALGRVQRRTTVLLCGVWTALASAAAMVGIGLMTNLNLDETFTRAGYVALSALISAVLAVGCLPLLESVFGVMTQQKLLELSNPNQPLLRMLQLEAPGTYHHALLVANLAEAAADAVGANALLCRVGAYYHDIGKVKRPMYFKENQLDDINPHDTMSPQVSAAILAEHVRDGRVMAEREKLPRPIIDIISQHHGTTTMAYFLYRAKKDAEINAEEVSEEDYRYDGPTPQTKEAAIIFIADSVEAAVRSIKDHSSDSIQTMIRKLVGERTQDGQLADVPLTLKDFHLMEKAFMRVLGGIYHTRVEYPELDKPNRREERAQ